MGSFSTPLSGLSAAQQQLQAISNNLANVNTIGYKSESLTFASLFEQSGATNGAGDPVQTGSGAALSSTVFDQTDGTANETGVSSNMAITGSGFFIVQKTDSDAISYTRDGSFVTNNQGDIVSTSGSVLLGYPAVNGVIDTSSALKPINVGTGVAIPATASTTVSITANLNSQTAINSSATNSSLPVYDSLGVSHTISVSYTKTGENTWSYTVTVPSDEMSNPDKGVDALGNAIVLPDTKVGSGTLVFDSTGLLDTKASSMAPIQISGLADLADDMTLNGPFGTVNSATGEITDPTITQTATTSGTSRTYTDGYSAGTLSSYTIDPDGTVNGTFSSGKTIALGQVALASFANVQGLKAIGDNCYQPTNSSGAAVIGPAQTGGRGTIQGGYTEGSNVDIASEFAKLIVAQQAYSASAKSITTFNQMSQATLQMLQ